MQKISLKPEMHQNYFIPKKLEIQPGSTRSGAARHMSEWFKRRQRAQ